MQVRRGSGNRDAAASASGGDRRLRFFRAALRSRRRRGMMRADLHLAAPPLKSLLVPSSAFRVDARAVQLSANKKKKNYGVYSKRVFCGQPVMGSGRFQRLVKIPCVAIDFQLIKLLPFPFRIKLSRLKICSLSARR